MVKMLHRINFIVIESLLEHYYQVIVILRWQSSIMLLIVMVIVGRKYIFCIGLSFYFPMKD